MVEDDVLQHLRALLSDGATTPVSCRISPPLQHAWGRPYRLVEWTPRPEADACRQVVAAESTALEIARLVAAHVPGRRIVLNGEPDAGSEERPGKRRRARPSTRAAAAAG